MRGLRRGGAEVSRLDRSRGFSERPLRLDGKRDLSTSCGRNEPVLSLCEKRLLVGSAFGIAPFRRVRTGTRMRSEPQGPRF